MIILCGAPGSGKTTIAKRIEKEYGMVRYSMDELHLLEHSELICFVVTSLQQEQDTVVDALYTKLEWRKTILEAIKNFKCTKTLIYVDTPLDECIRRNKCRRNSLPDFVIERVYNSIEPPTLDEGWDEIIYVSE